MEVGLRIVPEYVKFMSWVTTNALNMPESFDQGNLAKEQLSLLVSLAFPNIDDRSVGVTLAAFEST